jgi:hypothetical protein
MSHCLWCQKATKGGQLFCGEACERNFGMTDIAWLIQTMQGGVLDIDAMRRRVSGHLRWSAVLLADGACFPNKCELCARAKARKLALSIDAEYPIPLAEEDEHAYLVMALPP